MLVTFICTTIVDQCHGTGYLYGKLTETVMHGSAIVISIDNAYIVTLIASCKPSGDRL